MNEMVVTCGRESERVGRGEIEVERTREREGDSKRAIDVKRKGNKASRVTQTQEELAHAEGERRSERER